MSDDDIKDEDKKLVEITVGQFLELLMNKDEREILKKRISEYESKLAEAHALVLKSTSMFAKFSANTMSSPFEIETVEQLDKWVGGVRVALGQKAVKKVILIMATE